MDCGSNRSEKVGDTTEVNFPGYNRGEFSARYKRSALISPAKEMMRRARKVLGFVLGGAFGLCVAATIFMQFSGVMHTPQPSASDNMRMVFLCALLLAGMVICLKSVD